ncbi:hypothetical protein [Sphingomonas sp. 22176]|uniref:hypothetical protein n=1 Tax=Sphingomonas sp. 22176 TaxID=3453884 RepID=UPI003F8670D4
MAAAFVAYNSVVTPQVTALNERRALVQAQLDRQMAYVALVQTPGGGWTRDLGERRRAGRSQGRRALSSLHTSNCLSFAAKVDSCGKWRSAWARSYVLEELTPRLILA